MQECLANLFDTVLQARATVGGRQQVDQAGANIHIFTEVVAPLPCGLDRLAQLLSGFPRTGTFLRFVLERHCVPDPGFGFSQARRGGVADHQGQAVLVAAGLAPVERTLEVSL